MLEVNYSIGDGGLTALKVNLIDKIIQILLTCHFRAGADSLASKFRIVWKVVNGSRSF